MQSLLQASIMIIEKIFEKKYSFLHFYFKFLFTFVSQKFFIADRYLVSTLSKVRNC